jgi:acyl-CoA hydrolase
VSCRSGFYGPAERVLRELGAVMEYVPADFRRFEPILEAQRPRVLATAAAPPDAAGWMSLSLHAGAMVAELRRCAVAEDRVLVVECSPAYPTTLGIEPEHQHRVHVDEADVVVVSDRVPVILEDPSLDDVDRAIAAHATSFISDGCTLQTGIGSIPSVIAGLLAEGDGGDYGIHAEMFTTGLMRLHQAGKVTNRKGRFDGYSVTTFAAGNAELYQWLDGNTQVRFLPVDVVNSPEVIAANRRMVTINGALAVDLHGQVIADTIDGRQFSGIGGHEDFLAGPGLRLEDRSLLCLPSTAVVDGETCSRIVARLGAGSIVSTPRHQVDVVIAEHGVAELKGRTVRERAEALAAIADPLFRDELLDPDDPPS